MSWIPPPSPPPDPPPSPTEARAVAAAERVAALDVVRGVALLGVLLANLVFAFRVPWPRNYLPPDPAVPRVDQAVEAFLQVAIQGKAITLFSVLFGVGLAIQWERFSRAGPPLPRLRRRLLVLLAFGLAHLLLLWNGDILTEYALAGLVVLAFLRASTRTVARAAVAFYGFYLAAPFLPFMPAWPDDALLRAEVGEALRIYGSGSYGEIRAYSWHEWRLFSPIFLSLFGITPALFLGGVLLWRSGVLRGPPRWPTQLVAVGGIGLGLVLTLVGRGETLARATDAFTIYLAASFAPTVMAAGYGAALLLAVQRWPGAAPLRGFAAAGRMAFSNYIAQSLVFTTVFYGYGLAQFGRVAAAAAVAYGLAFFALQVAASVWWLRRFEYGPLEWLWRTLTYGKAQPMRRA